MTENNTAGQFAVPAVPRPPYSKETLRERVCSLCGAKTLGMGEFRKHRKEVHGLEWTTTKGSKKNLSSPLVQIHAAEQQIKEALLGLESERDTLHNRIVEIDNVTTQYRTWLGQKGRP